MTIDGKTKSRLALIKNAHSHGSTLSSERNPLTEKGRAVAHVEERNEDWGGPSFSLFQNESQDILADAIVRVENDEDGAGIEREKERDSGVDKVNSDKERSKENEYFGTEERHSLHNENIKSMEHRRRKEEQMKQLEELENKVAELKEEKEAQSLIMKNLQKQIFDAEIMNNKKEDESASVLQEIKFIRGENQHLSTALVNAMSKIEIHEVKEKRMVENANEMQNSLHSIQNQLEQKEKEKRNAYDAIGRKSRLIKAFQSRASTLEKEVYKKKNENVELKLRLLEQSNKIDSLMQTVEARDMEIVLLSERIKEMENKIENCEDVAISNDVHQITQQYAQNVEEEQYDIQRSYVADWVKERKERKRVKNEQYEHMLDKKVMAGDADLHTGDSNRMGKRKEHM